MSRPTKGRPTVVLTDKTETVSLPEPQGGFISNHDHCFHLSRTGKPGYRHGRRACQGYPSARSMFEEVDAALSQKLSRMMWEGPEAELTLTENAQPALMAVSLAAMRVLTEKGLDLQRKAAFVAGHSLGEYSALAAAGALSLADAARLLKTRRRA